MTRLVIRCLMALPLLTLFSCIEKPFESHSYESSNLDLNFQKIQKDLKPNQMLIQYNLDLQYSKALIKVVSHKNFKSISVNVKATFEDEVLDYHKLIQQFSLPQREKRNQFIDLSFQLYSLLIAPFREMLNDTKELIFVPEGILHLIPFETLIDSNEKIPFTKANFLVKNYNILYQESLTTLVNSNKKRVAHPNSFLGFAPVFNQNEFDTDDISHEIVMRDRKINTLVYSKREVTEIEKLFSSIRKMKTEILLEADANESNLKRKLSNNKYIHIASHGISDLNNPRLSGIVCSNNIIEDGILRSDEILRMNINSELVVLSSCESGVGKLDSKKIQGLHLSFLNAGASNVVYSLWKINDKVTSQLMIDFYSVFLSFDKPYSEALRSAKLKLLKNPSTASPNLWAPFVLMRA